ncbi:hypothetical protein [Avibacterium sp. 20-129]|nr:hypothetical protein [Avibacterium sp. 20-129]MCW9698152.1 hypothetical protein [Avibacterium sp. 20-129]
MTYTKLPLLVVYLAAHIPTEKAANRLTLGRQANKTMPKRNKTAQLPA